MEKFNAFGEKIKVGGSDLSRKMSAGMTTVSGKMKGLFQGSTHADKFVEDATAESLEGPDWGKSMYICDMINLEHLSAHDIVRALRKRLTVKNSKIQLLSLSLLETCVKNCEKLFSEVASQRVLDEIVKTVDDSQTSAAVREKALKLIESWGEATEELRYLPVFEETYKSLKSRGVQFPGRDIESLAPIFTPPRSVSTPPGRVDWQSSDDLSPEHTKEVFDVARNCKELLSTMLKSSSEQEVLKEELTSTLVEQCRQSQFSVQRIVESAGDNEPLLFEALNVNDELQQLLSKYEEMCTIPTVQINPTSEPALIPVGVVDEEESVVAGGEDSLVRNRPPRPHTFRSVQRDDTRGGFSGEEGSRGTTKKEKDDLIVF